MVSSGVKSLIGYTVFSAHTLVEQAQNISVDSISLVCSSATKILQSISDTLVTCLQGCSDLVWRIIISPLSILQEIFILLKEVHITQTLQLILKQLIVWSNNLIQGLYSIVTNLYCVAIDSFGFVLDGLKNLIWASIDFAYQWTTSEVTVVKEHSNHIYENICEFPRSAFKFITERSSELFIITFDSLKFSCEWTKGLFLDGTSCLLNFISTTVTELVSGMCLTIQDLFSPIKDVCHLYLIDPIFALVSRLTSLLSSLISNASWEKFGVTKIMEKADFIISGVGYTIVNGWEKALLFIMRPNQQESAELERERYDLIVEKILSNEKFNQIIEKAAIQSNIDIDKALKSVTVSDKTFSDNLETKLKAFDSEIEQLKLKVVENTKEYQNEYKMTVAALEEKISNLKDQVQHQDRIQQNEFLADSERLTSVVSDIGEIHKSIKFLETELEKLQAMLTNCCRTDTDIEASMMKVLNATFRTDNNETTTNNVVKVLSHFFATKTDLNDISLSLEESKAKIQLEVRDMMMGNNEYGKTDFLLEDLEKQLKEKETEMARGLNEKEVSEIVGNALIQYDADKTGLFDFALETAGGSVISTRCTETYVQKSGTYSLFGIPIWYPSNNPRTVIQPGVLPGECWAFKGSSGFIVIQLSEPIKPNQFSLEHISKSMSPSGRIDSAPKEFEVFGLQSERDESPVKLGEYEYQEDGIPLQFFPVQQQLDQPFSYIELDVKSNHGNLNYTCIYRFRVHGDRS